MNVLFWKGVFFSTALVSCFLSIVMFLLAIKDVVKVRVERMNGAVQFMTLDNLRHHGFVVLSSFILLSCSFILLSFSVASDTGLQVLTILTSITIVDIIFSFFRRIKMARLVGEHFAKSIKGGRRRDDPPSDPSEPGKQWNPDTDGGEGW